MLDSDLINVTIDRQKHTVLVVDDDPSTRYATARVIRSAGFQTKEATSGQEALAMVGPGISAVVLDVHLPDINGFEVCSAIKSQTATAVIPVMHLSAAFVKNEDKVTGLNAGADAYLIHPVEPAVLIATLQALVRARLAEDQLRSSEARFRAIYSHAQSGIVLVDAEGRFADVNPAMAQMLGRPHDALVGTTISALAPSDWKAFVAETLRDPGDSGLTWKGEFPLLHASGTQVQLEWIVSPHVEPGLRIGIALDVSERSIVNQRREEVLEREQAARYVAERHNRTKDDFIAVLSHELRTPLHATVCWVQVLAMRGGPPEMMEGLKAIERSVDTQARIISDILDVSRLNSGKLRLDMEWVLPSEVLTASIASLQQPIDKKRLVLELDIAPGAQQKAWLDPARFQQICWNLITNAIKFSHEAGVVRVGLARTGDALSLTVQDFGQGIKPEFLGHIFERFSQSDSPGNRRHHGLGLGLSIIKDLVELHGGTVHASSAGAGQGATLAVELPVAQRSEVQALVADAADTDAASDDGDLREHLLERVDILVVEDDAEAREMLFMLLSDRGASVRIAFDYDSALKAIGDKWPDVLISDVGLPGRDGYQLVQQVRKMVPTDVFGRLPVIALTAFARVEDEVKALESGFSSHIGKPFKPHVLVGEVRTLLDRSLKRS